VRGQCAGWHESCIEVKNSRKTFLFFSGKTLDKKSMIWHNVSMEVKKRPPKKTRQPERRQEI
jgi:hypothetical protein